VAGFANAAEKPPAGAASGLFFEAICARISPRPGNHGPIQNSALQFNMGSFNMFSISRSLGRRQSLGQGMTEYIIIVALIAVAAIGVYSYFGQTLRSQTAGIASEIAGKDSAANITKAQTSAGKAGDTAEKTKSLGSYGSAAELAPSK
jgi:Flp pilus assembly pilin Flp